MLDLLRRETSRPDLDEWLDQVTSHVGPDALYVALARRLECPLLALDRRLGAAPGLGVTVIVPG